MRHVWGTCILCSGIEPENVCFVGVQLTRANGFVNVWKHGGSAPQSRWSLFPGKPFETRENQKITWEYLGSPKNKRIQTDTHHSQDMTPIHKTIAVVFSWGAVPSGSIRVRPLIRYCQVNAMGQHLKKIGSTPLLLNQLGWWFPPRSTTRRCHDEVLHIWWRRYWGQSPLLQGCGSQAV